MFESKVDVYKKPIKWKGNSYNSVVAFVFIFTMIVFKVANLTSDQKCPDARLMCTKKPIKWQLKIYSSVIVHMFNVVVVVFKVVNSTSEQECEEESGCVY